MDGTASCQRLSTCQEFQKAIVISGRLVTLQVVGHGLVVGAEVVCIFQGLLTGIIAWIAAQGSLLSQASIDSCLFSWGIHSAHQKHRYTNFSNLPSPQMASKTLHQPYLHA